MLLPITLATTISEVPEYTAAIDVAISGNDVPKAMMVTPIINGLIPSDNPIFSALSTNLSDAYSNTIKLTTNNEMFNNKSKGGKFLHSARAEWTKSKVFQRL